MILRFCIIKDAAAARRANDGLAKPYKTYVDYARTMIRDTALDSLAGVPQMLKGLTGKCQSTSGSHISHEPWYSTVRK